MQSDAHTYLLNPQPGAAPARGHLALCALGIASLATLPVIVRSALRSH
jgi:hypothetical protein